MTDNQSPVLLPSPDTAQGKRMRGRIWFFIFVLVLAGLAGGAGVWMQSHGYGLPGAANNNTETVQKLAVLQRRFEMLDSRITDLTARVDEMAAAPAQASADTAKTAKTSTADLAHVQSDLAALAATVGGLQSDAAIARAESVAFVQLREAAMAGHSFLHELETLKAAAKNDAALMDICGKLAPFADKGAPSKTALREALVDQIGSVDRAIAKADAQGWWQRVLAELKSLVSIRVVHGAASPDASLDAMQAALAHDDLGTALDLMKNLPREAQQTLDGWKQQADARHALDENLQALADHLIEGAAVPVQDKP